MHAHQHHDRSQRPAHHRFRYVAGAGLVAALPLWRSAGPKEKSGRTVAVLACVHMRHRDDLNDA